MDKTLYRVRYAINVCVAAVDHATARLVADDAISSRIIDCGPREVVALYELKEAHEIPQAWKGSQPFGGDTWDTCEEYVTHGR